ncbi:hypothetical protein P5F77_17445 [Caldifermentibacillus hisashii]|uniref:hypothetical protein n=1 Tax=Caldifermentibacillus hisashii TaxID=996558 RepID=UPI0030D67CCE
MKRKWMRNMNINRLTSLIKRRRNNRNMLWLSLVGIGLAGGATAFGMTRGRNGSIQQMMKKATQKMEQFTPNMLNTNQS